MHKLLERITSESTLKKLIKNKNITVKSVNNHKIKNHKFHPIKHIVSKELEEIYSSLSPIYQSLNNDFMMVDLIDLEFYERWLNG